MANPAVFISRFQPLHLGHVFALSSIAKKHKRITVIIGSSQERGTQENPLSLSQRKKMLSIALAPISRKSGAAFRIMPLPDHSSHARWLNGFIRLIPKNGVVFTNNRFVRRLLKLRGIAAKGTGSHKRAAYQGKIIRKRMAGGPGWEKSVPKSVATYLKAINAEKKIRKILRKGG